MQHQVRMEFFLTTGMLMKNYILVALLSIASFLGAKTMKTPETSSLFRKFTHPETKVTSYILDKRIAFNQQSIYFTHKSMTDDGRFLILDISGGERGNTKTYALIDFLEDTLQPLNFYSGIPFLDTKTDMLYYVNRRGIFRRDLLVDPHKEIKLCPIPEELLKMGKSVKYFCTHLTLTADRQTAFLESRIDDSFMHGTVNLKDGTYELWGRTDFFANHGQLHPTNPRLAMCAWEGRYTDAQGVEHRIHKVNGIYPRIWLVEPGNKQTMIPPKVNGYATHETWAEDGKGLYYCSKGVIYHDLETGEQTLICPVKAAHANMSSDNKYITHDYSVGPWYRGCGWQVGFYNRETGKHVYLYPELPPFNTKENPSKLHPDPHPQFVCNNRYIVCTINGGNGAMDLSITPVQPLIEMTK